MNDPQIWNEYHETIAKEFFYLCSDKTVLEIAPFVGSQTQAIVKYPIKSLLLVEPHNVNNNIGLIELYPTATIINDDIFNVYHNKFLVDVVVACGFLYHLHSPFYFLELIVNQSDPEYIILDNIHHPLGIGIMNEVPNTPGNRYTTTPTWKTVNYSICLDFIYIDQALTDLGYRRINKIELAKFNNFSKERSWMASWQKITNE